MIHLKQTADIATLEFAGVFDHHAAEEVIRAAQAQPESQVVILDLSRAIEIDGRALGLLEDFLDDRALALRGHFRAASSRLTSFD